MNTQIWKVKFGNWTDIRVVANNAKEAMNKAMSQRRRAGDNYSNRLQDITSIELLEVADYE